MITKSDLVYESPDGGRTVYSRKTGETERTLVQEATGVNQRWKKWMLWRDILNASPEHPSLEDAIQKAEMIYELVKK
jgi:hypothetical protein